MACSCCGNHKNVPFVVEDLFLLPALFFVIAFGLGYLMRQLTEMEMNILVGSLTIIGVVYPVKDTRNYDPTGSCS